MIRHIVLLKIKPDINSDQVEKMYTNLLKLQDSIPGILSITGGRNNSPEHQYSKSYTQGFMIEFKDKEARDNYLSHLEHTRVAQEYILAIVDDIVVFDYEC